ncbi:MAG: hypothetical protein ACUVV3_10830 [Dehalococcoidia bacterium]
MTSTSQHLAFVVVVVNGTHDLTRTICPDAAAVERYTRALLAQGIRPANIRIYRTRLLKPHSPPA